MSSTSDLAFGGIFSSVTKTAAVTMTAATVGPTKRFGGSPQTRDKFQKKHAKEDSYLECFCGSVHGAPLYARIR